LEECVHPGTKTGHTTSPVDPKGNLGIDGAFLFCTEEKGEDMKNADFKKLIVNQTAEESACWFLD
jgi:hypothetical protein